MSSSDEMSQSIMFDSDDDNANEVFIKEYVENDPIEVVIVDAMEQEESSARCTRKKKRIERPRLIEEGAAKLQRDYFDSVPIYSDAQFRRRFRMNRSLFVKMADEVIEKVPYFRQTYDVAHRMGLRPYQKIIAVVRLLAYDISADALNENLRISANSALDCLKQLYRVVVNIYSGYYLREPTPDDVHQLNIANTRRGFPGMLGSIDCMHWKWKNCSTAWAGQYQSGHKKEPSIVLQVVASQNLWIWHAYFGASGCNNDINVLEELHLFDSLLEGNAPPCNYMVNRRQYNMGYYLTNVIYPPWACFVKTIQNPLTPKDCNFARYQEGVKKNVERAFGVLQARWHILRGSVRLWDQTDLNTSC